MENTTPVAPELPQKTLTLGQRIRNSISNLEVEIEKKKEELQQLFGRKAAFHDLLATAEAVGHDLDADAATADAAAGAPAAATTTDTPAAPVADQPAPTPAK
jgi:hypothetical protein